MNDKKEKTKSWKKKRKDSIPQFTVCHPPPMYSSSPSPRNLAPVSRLLLFQSSSPIVSTIFIIHRKYPSSPSKTKLTFFFVPRPAHCVHFSCGESSAYPTPASYPEGTGTSHVLKGPSKTCLWLIGSFSGEFGISKRNNLSCFWCILTSTLCYFFVFLKKEKRN